MAKGKKLSNNAFRRTQAVVHAFERNANAPPDTQRRGQQSDFRPPIRVILLEDLESGGLADATVTELIETNEVQDVKIIGFPAAGTFRLKFQSLTSPPINWNATAAEMQKALEATESIGKGNVAVALGKSAKYRPGVWLVTFTGKFNGVDVPLLEPTDNLVGSSIVVAETSVFYDTGRIEEVRGMIPVGIPTPMRAGAVALCNHYLNVGYGVHALECREFSPYDL